MKKTLCLLFAVVLTFSAVVFAGCGKEETKSSKASSSKAKSSAASQVETITPEPMSSEMQAVADKLEVKEYRCTGLEYEFIVFVVTNKSDTDCGLSVIVNFYDKDKNIVDCQQEDINAVGAGETACVAVYANEKFDSYTYDFVASELTNYEAIAKDLKLTVKEKDPKIEYSVTNNGDKTACFTEVHTLFFKGDEIYDYDKSYVGDDKSEIAPGATETKEVFNANGTDRYEYYMNSYAEVK
ncbi:MAG: hypothetical protein IJ932_03115 [Ruminococcus sp.]|nr:hypothetical protein [Ruminococcus sp.]